jgi:hypothetical protein
MDPVTIATSVMALLVPYVLKGADTFAEETGKSAFEHVSGLLGKLKRRWRGDDEARLALEQFEAKPERYQGVLRDILIEKLKGDAAFADELSSDLQPLVEVTQKMREGQDVTGVRADELTQGTVRVEQDIERGIRVVGANLGKIGS